jgi:hypothetical protein
MGDSISKIEGELRITIQSQINSTVLCPRQSHNIFVRNIFSKTHRDFPKLTVLIKVGQPAYM